MNKLLMHRESGRAFDTVEAVGLIERIIGVSKGRWGEFIGSCYEATFRDPFSNDKEPVVVRVSKGGEYVVIEGAEAASFAFAFAAQEMSDEPLWLMNMGYDFNLHIGLYSSAGDLLAAAQRLS